MGDGNTNEFKYNKIKKNLNLAHSSSVVLSTKPSFVTVKADSGATKHYFRPQDATCLQNIKPTNGPTIFLPNMETIHTTHSGFLPCQHLSPTAKTTNILPKLQSASLLWLDQLCENNCDVLLNKKFLKVFKNNQQIIKGYRNIHDGLWDVHIPTHNNLPYKNHHKLSVIIQKNILKKDLV